MIIIIIIIVIILFFIFLLYKVCKPSRTGLQALERSADLRRRSEETQACGSTSNTRFCKPKRAGLKTLGMRVCRPRRADPLAWVCSQARGFGSSTQDMATPASGVCSLEPASPPCPTKIWTDYFLSNHHFNVKCIPMKRQPHPPLQSLQLFVARITLSLHYFNPQCFVSR